MDMSESDRPEGQKEDGKMKLPSYIWRLSSGHPGPNVVVLGGTHGDELPGIEAVRRILNAHDLLARQAGSYSRTGINGNLFIGFGNPEAIMRRLRGVTGRGLNRCFAPEILRDPDLEAKGEIDAIRARELVPLLEDTDFLFDLHATSSPSDPFVAFGKDSKRQLDVYGRIPVKHILTDPDGVLARLEGISTIGTTDYQVAAYGGSEWGVAAHGEKGGVAVCYEAGHESDLALVDTVTAVTLDLLQHVGSITSSFAAIVPGHDKLPPVPEQTVMRLVKVVDVKLEGFTYAKGMFDNWLLVKKGDLLGTYADGTEERIEQDGFLLFPKAAHKLVVGKDLYFLAERV